MRIPDVPGCHDGGPTPEAAISDAINALHEHAVHQTSKGVPLKPPRSMREIMLSKDAEFAPDKGEVLV